MTKNPPPRRDFLTREVVATAAVFSTLPATAATKSSGRTTGRVLGANDRINIAFIGNGMQFQGLLGVFKNRKQQKSDVEFMAGFHRLGPPPTYGPQKSGASKAD